MPVNHQHQNPTPPIRWIRPALGPETEGAERSEEGEMVSTVLTAQLLTRDSRPEALVAFS